MAAAVSISAFRPGREMRPPATTRHVAADHPRLGLPNENWKRDKLFGLGYLRRKSSQKAAWAVVFAWPRGGVYTEDKQRGLAVPHIVLYDVRGDKSPLVLNTSLGGPVEHSGRSASIGREQGYKGAAAM